MSKLYCFAAHRNGIFMVGDTRLTIPNENGAPFYQDGIHKVHKLSDNLLIGIAGCEKFADVMLQFAEDEVKFNNCEYPEELAQLLHLKYGLLSHRQISDSVEIMIAGYSFDQEPQIILLLDRDGFAIDKELEFNSHTNELAGFWRTIGIPRCEPGFREDIENIFRTPHAPDTGSKLILRAQKSIVFYSENFSGMSPSTHFVSIPYPASAPLRTGMCTAP